MKWRAIGWAGGGVALAALFGLLQLGDGVAVAKRKEKLSSVDQAVRDSALATFEEGRNVFRFEPMIVPGN